MRITSCECVDAKEPPMTDTIKQALARLRQFCNSVRSQRSRDVYTLLAEREKESAPATGDVARLIERIIRGEVYKAHYRTWPDIYPGNVHHGDILARHCDKLAEAVIPHLCALRVENARMKAALQPFARMADEFDRKPPRGNTIQISGSGLQLFENARAALTAGGKL
jgi:hypothetical protein